MQEIHGELLPTIFQSDLNLLQCGLCSYYATKTVLEKVTNKLLYQ